MTRQPSETQIITTALVNERQKEGGVGAYLSKIRRQQRRYQHTLWGMLLLVSGLGIWNAYLMYDAVTYEYATDTLSPGMPWLGLGFSLWWVFFLIESGHQLECFQPKEKRYQSITRALMRASSMSELECERLLDKLAARFYISGQERVHAIFYIGFSLAMVVAIVSGFKTGYWPVLALINIGMITFAIMHHQAGMHLVEHQWEQLVSKAKKGPLSSTTAQGATHE